MTKELLPASSRQNTITPSNDVRSAVRMSLCFISLVGVANVAIGLAFSQRAIASRVERAGDQHRALLAHCDQSGILPVSVDADHQ